MLLFYVNKDVNTFSVETAVLNTNNVLCIFFLLSYGENKMHTKLFNKKNVFIIIIMT